MDLEHIKVVLKWCLCILEVDSGIGMNIIMIIRCVFLVQWCYRRSGLKISLYGKFASLAQTQTTFETFTSDRVHIHYPQVRSDTYQYEFLMGRCINDMNHWGLCLMGSVTCKNRGGAAVFVVYSNFLSAWSLMSSTTRYPTAVVRLSLFHTRSSWVPPSRCCRIMKHECG